MVGCLAADSMQQEGAAAETTQMPGRLCSSSTFLPLTIAGAPSRPSFLLLCRPLSQLHPPLLPPLPAAAATAFSSSADPPRKRPLPPRTRFRSALSSSFSFLSSLEASVLPLRRRDPLELRFDKSHTVVGHVSTEGGDRKRPLLQSCREEHRSIFRDGASRFSPHRVHNLRHRGALLREAGVAPRRQRHPREADRPVLRSAGQENPRNTSPTRGFQRMFVSAFSGPVGAVVENKYGSAPRATPQPPPTPPRPRPSAGQPPSRRRCAPASPGCAAPPPCGPTATRRGSSARAGEGWWWSRSRT